MTRLYVYDETDPAALLVDTEDGGSIAHELNAIGVRFERWEASAPLLAEADQEAVIAAYQTEIDRLKAECGYRAVDVVRMQPDHPQREAFREKFLDEHTHSEDEVRFFVEGSGAFYLRKAGRVFKVVCTKDDLISVPAGTTHWFDMGPAPRFTAIRLFENSDGWIAKFTGDTIARRFPLYAG
ncbi:1,2-dihydroxy-3-keto-5-methylthiopentene dioxygenase [Inquilinus limosus]|uniref:Acireductone dioxygenase n=1 Tax=Inquilinus limosus TaxID=171674 RepID=A0A211ZH20_9PROT|nr:cupin [Inquilinus limosus]OWJ64486.1 cupin [Inquilinus limosus]